ncbi:patellin-4-like [Gossypium australe]|uniref:Patellin-4-like n=1 Tax=Gossypium australe TaxID=47621 RepID=A0A5B6W175_9ROSI|nr:patellin-4-like [Gossypium australe]
MGKKRENTNKAKESGKVQDQNMANLFDYEIALQVQEGHEKGCPSQTNSDQETDEETFEEPPSVREDRRNVAMRMKERKFKALAEFRCRVEDAILGDYLFGKPSNKVGGEDNAKAIEQLKEITLWGVPLMPSKRHGGTDIVLLKFLEAKDYKVLEALEMLQRTLKWRKEFKADEILEENLVPGFENLTYQNSSDKDGHPVYYNVYGALKDQQTQYRILGSEEKREKFLRWRVQYMEKAIKELRFQPGGTNSIVQIIDMKHAQGPTTKELRSIIADNHKCSLVVLYLPYVFFPAENSEKEKQDCYCQTRESYFHSSQVRNLIIYSVTNIYSLFLLLIHLCLETRFIPPENLPVEYGGFKRENDDDFSPEDKVSEVTVRANAFEHIRIPAPQAGVTMVWDLTVVGSCDVSYMEEFIPDDEGSYKVLLQNEKEKKKREGVRNSFYISEPGKIVITFDNPLLKKTKVLYRYKTKPTVPIYVLNKK